MMAGLVAVDVALANERLDSVWAETIMDDL
jgi:hypothetical protein